ncbi:DUF998 domain-containing protein [Lentzea sp. NPDC051838]|uniref:DUF998 domain-containing protein n=1 Tax=Lentzea sp. NPDC051838 TaxID=3154849 RepID=UPI0034278E88
MADYWFTPYKGIVISYNTLRRLVGAIGVALPIVLGGVGWFLTGKLEPSISAYYYTDLRDWFVGSLWAFGVFLIAYRLGRLDNVLATVAGVLAIVVSLIPTAATGTPEGARSVGAMVHLICAGGFFVLLAVLSLLFAKDRDHYKPTFGQKVLHRVCAGCILLSVVGCLFVIMNSGKDVQADTTLVFWFETAGVVAFGVSWFTTVDSIVPVFARKATQDRSGESAISMAQR